jgi:RNA polymerase sigma-70 factor, ECF subfamily
MNLMPQEVPQTRPEINSGILLERMYLELRPRFLALAYSILRNREDAEDAVQEAFTSAHRNFPAFEGRSAVATWLTRIVVNAALMQLRKRKSSLLVAPPESDLDSKEGTPWMERVRTSRPDPEALCAEAETLQMVDDLLHTASPLISAAFKMKLYDDVSAEAGAKQLGITANTFKSRVFRARKHLRARGKHSLIAPIRRPLHATARANDRDSWSYGNAA